jgi:hypothetical protein
MVNGWRGCLLYKVQRFKLNPGHPCRHRFINTANGMVFAENIICKVVCIETSNPRAFDDPRAYIARSRSSRQSIPRAIFAEREGQLREFESQD